MGFVSDIVGGITGSTAAEASLEGARIQAGSTREGIAETRASRELGLGFLSPFSGVGQQGIDQSSFLTDPQAQFDFLQGNPLFTAALESANTQTQQQAAARGRISSGDTQQQLSNNFLLSASPLIQQQKGSILDLLNIGTGIAGSQANIATGTGAQVTDLITSGGAAEAAGVVGAANARSQGVKNLFNIGATALLAPISSSSLAGRAFA